MSTVVIIGYSASGKSTIGDEVRKRWRKTNGNLLEYRDSDAEIGAKFDGHIYNAYLKEDYDVALELIEHREREFLDSLGLTQTPRLVVPGPNVPLRLPEWRRFLDRVEPVVYHFTVTPEMCRLRLAGREEKIARNHGSSPRFGSWNNGSLRDWSEEEGRYVPVPEIREVNRRLESLMADNLRAYEAVADISRTYDAQDLQNRQCRERVTELILEDLIS